MPGETQTPETPKEPWKQWQEAWEAFHETLTRIWQPMLEGNQDQMVFGKLDPFGLPEPAQLWAQWLGTAAPDWREGIDMREVPALWQEMMEQARAKMQAGEHTPEDHFSALKQWYDSTSEMWSKVVGDAIGTDQFAEAMGRILESYTSFSRMFRQVSKASFHNLQLPTRSDIARLAELVVSLEEKVDRIEDSLEQSGFPPLQEDAGEARQHLEARLEQLENKLDKVLVLLEKMTGEREIPADPVEP